MAKFWRSTQNSKYHRNETQRFVLMNSRSGTKWKAFPSTEFCEPFVIWLLNVTTTVPLHFYEQWINFVYYIVRPIRVQFPGTKSNLHSSNEFNSQQNYLQFLKNLIQINWIRFLQKPVNQITVQIPAARQINIQQR